MDIKELCVVAGRMATEKGFRDTPESNFPARIALAHSELSEALEAHRLGDPPIAIDDGGKPYGVVVELADTVIRIADMCDAEGWDLDGAIIVKLGYNNRRKRLHGKEY